MLHIVHCSLFGRERILALQLQSKHSISRSSCVGVVADLVVINYFKIDKSRCRYSLAIQCGANNAGVISPPKFVDYFFTAAYTMQFIFCIVFYASLGAFLSAQQWLFLRIALLQIIQLCMQKLALAKPLTSPLIRRRWGMRLMKRHWYPRLMEASLRWTLLWTRVCSSYCIPDAIRITRILSICPIRNRSSVHHSMRRIRHESWCMVGQRNPCVLNMMADGK